MACGLSSCGSRALEQRLSSCGTWASLPRGMWDLPRPGLEPMSPALAGRFLTTVPPGESLTHFLNWVVCFFDIELYELFVYFVYQPHVGYIVLQISSFIQ